MGLDYQDRVSESIRGAVAAVGLRVVSLIGRSLVDGLAFFQAYGDGDPDDAQNQDLLQDVRHVSHFGFSSSAPADTQGIVANTGDTDYCIAERNSLEDLDTHGGADQMPALATGDTCIYSQNGTYIFLDATGKLTIRAKTDNIELITDAGKQIKLGQNGATYRDIAYAHNSAAGSSQVAARIEFENWTANVLADITAIKTDMTNIDALLVAAGTLTANVIAINAWILAHTTGVIGTPLTHPVPPVPVTLGPPGAKAATGLNPDTTAEISEDSDFAYVSSGSDKAEVEP